MNEVIAQRLKGVEVKLEIRDSTVDRFGIVEEVESIGVLLKVTKSDDLDFKVGKLAFIPFGKIPFMLLEK